MFVLLSRSLRQIHYLVEDVAGSQSAYCNNQQLWALLKATIALNVLQEYRVSGEYSVNLPWSSRMPGKHVLRASHHLGFSYPSREQRPPINCSGGLIKRQIKMKA